MLGSVHWLGGLAVDHPDYAIWDEMAADEVWRRYFAQVRAAAASGLFDVLAHLDLAKVFGHSGEPVRDRQRARADRQMRLRRPASPSRSRRRVCARPPASSIRAQDLLRALHRRGVPITLGSDGHVPEDLGRDYPRALAAAHACGYRTVSMFSGRERREAPLG